MLTAAALAVVGLGTVPAGAQDSGEVKITGSSTVEPIAGLVAELFAEENPDVQIEVQGPGSSDGYELFCSTEPGQWDGTNGSRAMDEDEAAECEANSVEFTELLVGVDGLTIVANKNSPLKCLDHQQIYAIFGPESEGGEVNLADAQALAEELGSTNKPLPDGNVGKFTPGTESGTYGSFIEINYEDLMEERLASGDIPADRVGDEEGEAVVTEPVVSSATFPNDNDIVNRVTGSDDGIGFFGFSYFTANKGDLKAVKIYNEDEGKCIKPTAKTIEAGTYPIARPLFTYPNHESLADNSAVKGYYDFFISEDSLTTLVTEAGYVPASAEQREETIAAYEAIG
jgi:phosphate transport system substrate-binding protein